MVLCTKKRRSLLNDPQLNLPIKNNVIECVTQHYILGLTVDQNLCWDPHITNLCKKLSSVIGLL